MRSTNSRKRRERARSEIAPALNFNTLPALVVVSAKDACAQIAQAPPRGVKLRSVANFVMVTAILCLLAFLAGQSPNTAGAAEGLPGSAARAGANPTIPLGTISTRSSAMQASAASAAAIPAKEAQSMFLGLRLAVYSAKDLAKAKAWYATVLGVPPYFDQPFYIGFNIHGYELGLVPEPEAAPNRSSAGIAYWGVSDARAAYKRLLDLGATPREEIQDVGGGILAGTVHDPFGNVLGVIENPHFKVTE
ncbi:MAG: VOC family protein [Candidatus Acidiferrales bacterium]